MKLYEIPEEYIRAAAEYQRTLDEAEESCAAGEITADELALRYDAAAEIYGEYLGFTTGEFERKAEATAMVIRNIEAAGEVEAARAKQFEIEYARYRNRARAAENQARRLKEYIKAHMGTMGLAKIEGVQLKLAVQRNSVPAIRVVDLDAVPAEFLIPQPPKLNNEMVKADWKAGAEVPGVSVELGNHLRIR